MLTVVRQHNIASMPGDIAPCLALNRMAHEVRSLELSDGSVLWLARPLHDDAYIVLRSSRRWDKKTPFFLIDETLFYGDGDEVYRTNMNFLLRWLSETATP